MDATDIEASFTKSSGNLGVPIAADDRAALDIAVALVTDAGCEPLVVGSLDAARSFQRGNPRFRANTTLARLQRVLSLLVQ